jgi:hypothetical protein
MSQATAVTRAPARPGTRTVPQQRQQRPAPRLRVVAPAPRRSFTGLALLCVALLGAGLLALLLLNISIGKGAYALTELQSQQRQLTIQQQALSQDVEDLGAPQNLAARAQKLGMVPAPNTAFVNVPGGKIDGDPAVAVAPPKPVKKKPATTTSAKDAKTAKTKDAKAKDTKAKDTKAKDAKPPAKKKTVTSTKSGTGTGKKKTTPNQADPAR